MNENLKCWMCRRTFEEALKEFNEAIQSDQEIHDELKARYIKDTKEFFPAEYDRFVGFRQATIEKGKYTVTGKIAGRVLIWLCPVCSGIFESILDGIDEMIEDRVSMGDLENVSIRINKRGKG